MEAREHTVYFTAWADGSARGAEICEKRTRVQFNADLLSLRRVEPALALVAEGRNFCASQGQAA